MKSNRLSRCLKAFGGPLLGGPATQNLLAVPSLDGPAAQNPLAVPSLGGPAAQKRSGGSLTRRSPNALQYSYVGVLTSSLDLFRT